MRKSSASFGLIIGILASPLIASANGDAEPATIRAPTKLADLPDRWRSAMKDLGVPGMAVVVVKGNQVIYRETFGSRDPKTGAPVTSDTAFYIASSTKSFVALAIMQLVEQGKIDLDAPVRKYLPRFELADAKLAKRLTIRDLLSHAKGIDSDPIVFLDAYSGQITDDLYYRHLRNANIRGSFEYTNVHYTLLGRVIDAASAKPWKDYLADHIFAPAGMIKATCYADEMYGRPDVAFPTVMDSAGLRRSKVRKTDRTMHAAGGMGTSINDLTQWLLINLNGGRVGEAQILSAKGIDAMHSLEVKSGKRGFRLPNREPLGYGLGWFVGRYKDVPYIDHGGGYTGTSAAITLIPQHGLGVAAVANSSVPLPHIVTSDILDRLLSLEETDLLPRFKMMVERRASQLRALDTKFGRNPAVRQGGLSLKPSAYVGRYENADWGILEIAFDGRNLTARIGDLPLQMGSVGIDRFQYRTEGASTKEARFEIEGGSSVVALVADVSDTGKAVRFERRPAG